MQIEEGPVWFEIGKPGPGTAELIAFYPVWDLPRVKQIPTFTIRLNMETQ